jgi:hypothetical protein
MDVEFRISSSFDHSTGEPELERLPAAQLQELGQREWFQGVLVLSDAGQPSVRISDEIEPWIQNLCYGAVPPLLAGEPCEVFYFSKPGLVRLDPEGDAVQVSGDRIESALYPRRDLALALFACGDRFVAWARGVKRGRPELLGGVESALEYRPAALAALRAAGLTPPDAD